MRRLIILSLLAGLVACESAASPSASINVRVRDDRGDPVARNAVTVTHPDGTRVTALTGNDGTTQIGVRETGTYQVSVVPRDGYLSGIEPLSKTLTVDETGIVSVEFTLHRAGHAFSRAAPDER